MPQFSLKWGLLAKQTFLQEKTKDKLGGGLPTHTLLFISRIVFSISQDELSENEG